MNKKKTTQKQDKWYRGDGGAITFLIFCFPVGIYLMWRYTQWPSKAKWIVTSVFILPLLIASIIIASSEPPSDITDNNVISKETESDSQKNEKEQSASDESEKESAEESLEYKLAVINEGGYVSEDDATINRFRYLLKIINGKTKNSKQEIADMTCNGWEMLEDDYGVEVSLLEFMEGANDSIPPNNDIKVDYGEILAAYVLLMGQ